MNKLGLVRKSVSFNLNVPDELAMVELIEQSNFNFSKWVKRYLAMELKARGVTSHNTSSSITVSHVDMQGDV